MSNKIKILYFEFSTSGHRVLYIQDFLNAFIEKYNQLVTIGLCIPQNFNTQNIDRRIKIFKLPGEGLETISLWRFYIKYYYYLWYSRKIYLSKKYQIFHLLYLDSVKIPTAVFILINKLLNTLPKLYITLHWSKMDSLSNNIVYRLFKNFENMCFRQIFCTANSMFIHGEKIKQELLAKFPHLEAGKISVIPYPFNFQSAIIPKQYARKKLNLPLKDFLLLSFGATRKEKGIDILIKALAKIPQSVSIKVIIAGKPQDFKQDFLKQLAWQNQSLSKIIFRLNYISDEDKPYYFYAADAIILPYRSNFYGQSGVLPHAVKYRRPLIASDVSQVGFDVKKYQLGLVVPPENVEALSVAITKMYKALNKINYFMKNRWRYIRQNSLIVMMQKTWQTYKNSHISTFEFS